MEINYELIMKYLVTKKSIFASKKHILIYCDQFPDKFKDLFQNKFYRYGINQNNSFYNTLLTLLNKHFITFNSDEENIEVLKFKKSISETSEYLNKSDNLNKLEVEIQLLSEILDINFLIFDFKEEDIKIVYNGLVCNPYKPTLLIANYEEFYEPIFNDIDNKKLFSYNEPIIKKIYQLELKTYNDKVFKLNDDINELITELIPKKNNINETPFIKPIESEYTTAQLLKMTKKYLEVILDKKNIKININKTLKKDIVELILK